jgi:hypothetical protein
MGIRLLLHNIRQNNVCPDRFRMNRGPLAILTPESKPSILILGAMDTASVHDFA